MYKYFIISLQTILFLSLPLNAIDSHQKKSSVASVKCDPRLQPCLKAIQQIPEGKALIESIQKEGPIQIHAENSQVSQQFGAYWDPDRRIICIAYSDNRSKGTMIGSLLFELHNASVNSKIKALDELAWQGKIDKENYIRSMEYLEYINSHNASKIANKGIQMGIFPKSAHLPVYSNFNEHYSAQKKSGHSAYFGRNYELSKKPSIRSRQH